MQKRLVLLVVVFIASMAIGQSGNQASAAPDADCKGRKAYGDRGYTRYIPAAGWGLTGWRVTATAQIKDRCDHGEARATISLYDANVEAKGGQLRINWVSYKRSTDSRYTPMSYLKNYYDAYIYTGGPHVDLADTTRITHIRIMTSVWIRQDGSRWVAVASAITTCNFTTLKCT